VFSTVEGLDSDGDDAIVRIAPKASKIYFLPGERVANNGDSGDFAAQTGSPTITLGSANSTVTFGMAGALTPESITIVGNDL
jgi:hypothetical protein